MNSRLILGAVLVAMAVWCSIAAAQVEGTASVHSQTTDLSATPNSADDSHNFDNTTAATTISPTTTSAMVQLPHGSANGSVTAAEGLFQGLATSAYQNTNLNEAAQTDLRASATDLVTITSATLAANTPVTVDFSLSLSGTLTSPEVSGGGNYSTFATALFTIAQQFHSGNSLTLTYNSTSGTRNVLSGSFDGFVGENLLLFQSMELMTYVNGIFTFGHPSSATADFCAAFNFWPIREPPALPLSPPAAIPMPRRCRPVSASPKAWGTQAPFPAARGTSPVFNRRPILRSRRSRRSAVAR